MTKRVIANIDDDKHASFKAKLAADRLTMGEVINWAIDDYLVNKWRPRPRDRQKGKAKA